MVYSAHYTEPLLSLANTQLPLTGLDPSAEQLYSQIDTSLKPPFTADAIRDVLTLLQDDVALHEHPSEVVLQAVLARVSFGLYANALDLYLDEASAAQDDAEWWAEVEQSNQLAALYLLQSKPATFPANDGTLITYQLSRNVSRACCGFYDPTIVHITCRRSVVTSFRPEVDCSPIHSSLSSSLT